MTNYSGLLLLLLLLLLLCKCQFIAHRA